MKSQVNGITIKPGFDGVYSISGNGILAVHFKKLF
jgi:hypothetical protein